MTVTIPAATEHQGYLIATYEITDKCPVCGGPRGIPYGTHSFDGSRRMNVDGWNNPCGHVDTYAAVRKEGVRVKYREPLPFNNQ